MTFVGYENIFCIVGIGDFACGLRPNRKPGWNEIKVGRGYLKGRFGHDWFKFAYRNYRFWHDASGLASLSQGDSARPTDIPLDKDCGKSSTVLPASISVEFVGGFDPPRTCGEL
jgi:hypothetical protein